MRSKAVVFGGGGSVGMAWQTGLNAGWRRADIDLASADLIVGTSAGAAVGVQIALRHDLEAQMSRYAVAHERVTAGGSTRVMTFDQEQSRRVQELFARGQATGREDPRVRAEICRSAVEAETMSQEESNYVCTTVNVDTGDFAPLDAGSAGSLAHGVAAAVAVPGIYPPVNVGTGRYIDGGCLSTTHLDLAAGYDQVLFVQMTPTPAREIDALSGSQLLTIEPDAESLGEMGDDLMDGAAAFAAVGAGLAQGLRTADAVRGFWGM